jgi:hypothetical protein
VTATTEDFAGAVERLRARGRIADEPAISRELRWTLALAALIALGQQAAAEGLVRITYQGRYERRYERA